MPMKPAEWTMLVCLSLLWGGSFLYAEIALRELPPLTIVALRVGIAALALHLVLLATGRWRLPAPGVLLAFLAMGALNNAVPFSLIVLAQTQITSGLASILNATTPLFAVLAAHALTDDERLTPLRATGVLLGFGGVVAMIGLGALDGAGNQLWAELAMLGATCCYALAGIFARRFKHLGVTPLETATGQLTGSSLLLLPLALIVNGTGPLVAAGIEAWAAVLAFALLATALAFILYFRILATAGATNLLLVTFLIPPSAILLGVLVLGETIDVRQIGGMALIALGLVCIDGRLLRTRLGGFYHGRVAK